MPVYRQRERASEWCDADDDAYELAIQFAENRQTLHSTQPGRGCRCLGRSLKTKNK